MTRHWLNLRLALVVTLFQLFLNNTFAAPPPTEFQGFVKLQNNQELYVEFKYPKGNAPILVVLNGLTYSLRSWDRMIGYMDQEAYGILRYDPRGQGRTLMKYAPISEDIPISTQVEDLHELLNYFNIRQADLIGLSYGGGLAIAYGAEHPDRVGRMILMAPYVAALQDQDKWIKDQIRMTRLLNPLASQYTDDELYNDFFRTLVYTTYPAAEPVVLENPYKLEATFRLANGIRKFVATEVVGRLPKDSVHVIIAANDQYVPAKVHEDFWNAIPNDVKLSRIFVKYSEHKLPEAQPEFAAAWVNQIMKEDARISQGRTFTGSPLDFTAESGRVKIKLRQKNR